jgi:hypothetical protein
MEYKNQEILDYTYNSYDRVSNSFSLQPLRNRVFRNKILTLIGMENEHIETFNEALEQVKKVDALLNLE